MIDRPAVYLCSPPTLSFYAQDIELCAMAIHHADDRITPAWRFALLLLGDIRRWIFLPVLVTVAPVLVIYKGGDALSVCFNTVAVLFLCEIDNMVYAILLPERERARVEQEGRVELGEVEAAALMRSKAVHLLLLVVVVPCTVVGSGSGDVVGWELWRWLPVFAFWAAGATEAVLGSVGARQVCQKVGKVTGRSLLGFVGLALLARLSTS